MACNTSQNDRNGKKTIGFVVKDLSNVIKRHLGHDVFGDIDESMSGVHGWVICFIYDEGKKRDIYQRDIEKHFNIRRSSVTGMIQTMEKNGLIKRESVANDARLKKITLTEKAIKNHLLITERLNAFDNKLEAGLTEEELDVFLKVVEKVKQNLESEGTLSV